MNRENAAFVCSHVFADSRPVLLVAREDGDWMYLCGQGHEPDEQFHVVGLEHLHARHPSLHDVDDLHDNARGGARRSRVTMGKEKPSAPRALNASCEGPPARWWSRCAVSGRVA